MRILLLGDINSPHINKWANSLNDSGVEVGVFSISPLAEMLSYNLSVEILDNRLRSSSSFSFKSAFSKIKYLKLLPTLKKAIKQFNPDILHAHYASSYGLLRSLSGFHPYCVSVWGSDVYDFPNTSPIAKIYKVETDYLVMTENSIYIVDVQCPTKRIS